MRKLVIAGVMLALSASAHATEYCGVRVAVSHGRVPVYTEPNIRSFKMRLLPDGAMLDIISTGVIYDEEEWTPIKDNGWVETKYTQAIECTRAPLQIDSRSDCDSRRSNNDLWTNDGRCTELVEKEIQCEAKATSMSTKQCIHFRLIHAPCCGTMLCRVNPGLPNYCPDF